MILIRPTLIRPTLIQTILIQTCRNPMSQNQTCRPTFQIQPTGRSYQKHHPNRYSFRLQIVLRIH